MVHRDCVLYISVRYFFVVDLLLVDHCEMFIAVRDIVIAMRDMSNPLQ